MYRSEECKDLAVAAFQKSLAAHPSIMLYIQHSRPTALFHSLLKIISESARATLQDTLESVEAENAEKKQLGTGKNYDRSLP